MCSMDGYLSSKMVNHYTQKMAARPGKYFAAAPAGARLLMMLRVSAPSFPRESDVPTVPCSCYDKPTDECRR